MEGGRVVGRGVVPTEREAVLLAVLASGERYGVELREAWAARTGRAMPAGSVYTTLDRMEAKGFVASRYGEEPEGETARGGRRRWFRITEEGRRGLVAFRERLEELGEAVGGQA